MLGATLRVIEERIQKHADDLASMRRLLSELDPHRVLERGYALVRGDFNVGGVIEIETKHDIINAEVKHVTKR